MKKLLFSLVLMLGLASYTLPGYSIDRASLVSYASSLKGKKKAELKTAIYNLCQPDYVPSYGSGSNGTWYYFYVTDRNVATNECINRYSTNKYYFGSRGSAISGMNIEHSFPKSWWGGAKNNAYKDLYNLYPSESSSNSSKSNYPMGKVTNPKDASAYELVGTGTAGSNGTINLFEPNDTWKGDFCRSYFYMATIYQNLTWQGTQGKQELQNDDWPTLQEWAYTLYLEWTREDQVLDVEVERNNAVYGIQGNRNLYIDFPYLAEYVWGDSIDVEFDPTTSITTAEDDHRYTTTSTTVSAPTFSLVSGTYDSEQTVTISCLTSGAKIYYTTDGTTPTSSSTEYTAPITISKTTTLKAIAVYGGVESGVRTAVYTFSSTYRYELATTIESGKKYLIVANNSGTLKAASPLTTNYGYIQAQTVTATNNVISLDTEDYEFTFTVSGSGYTIQQSDGKYLYQTESYNSFNVSTSAPSDGGIWTVVKQSDGTFKITNVSMSKYIQYSTTYGSYGSYSSESGIMPNLYVLSTDPIDCDLVYSESSASVMYGDDELILPSLTNSYNVSPITYSSSNTSVATINTSGGVTLTGVGTTTITASFAGNSFYNPSSASYTLTVTKGDANLEYSSSTATAALGRTFNAPTLSYAEGIYADDITYSSSNTSVATIDASGNVIVVGLGTTTITASYAATANYNSSSASYTLSVAEAPENPVFVKVTSASQLVAGMRYLIVYEKDNGSVALSSQSGNYRLGASVTIEDNSITLTESNTSTTPYILTLGGSIGAWTFYDGENYLSLTKDNNYLNTSATATSTNEQWSIDLSSSTGIIQNKAYTSRYIKYNTSNPRFACYKTSSSQQEVALYVESIPTTINLSITSAGYATYYNSSVAYVMPESVEGYVVYYDNDTWNFEKVYEGGSTVPVDEALVLMGDEGNYSASTTTSSATTYTSAGKNDLRGTDTETQLTADEDYYFYALSLNSANEEGSIGFYWMNSTGSAFTNKAHKAYLKVKKSDVSTAKMTGFSFAEVIEGATGISEIVTSNTTESAIYNLSGQRVTSDYKGIQILNGKKYLNR